MNVRSSALPLALAALSGCGGSGSVVINEFMASNATGLVDEAGAHPDWIELYNRTDEAVSLDGWSISDDPAAPDRTALDGLKIPAGGYLVLYADGDVTEGELHLPFRLSKSGEDILLSDPDGVVDEISYAAQKTDVSQARIPDGGETWESAQKPTPGASNDP